jgi:uncharacterized protein YbjT (DUF2867 family)
MKSIEQETILVTGATGNVESEVVKQLSRGKTDVNIKAAVHSVENAKKVEGDGIDVVQIFYSDVPNAIEHASNMVTEAKKAGIRHIVKLSASGSDIEAPVASLRLHRQTEKIIEESGIPYTFLRPGEFMQNFVNWFSQTIKEEGAFWRVGDTKVSFVDVRDIAAVAVQALINNHDGRHNGKAYTITGPEALSYYQVAEILSNATGKKIDYVNISKEDARRRLENSALSDWWINIIIEVLNMVQVKKIAR